MTITTPWHAAHQRDQCAGQCAHGRQTRTHPTARMPHALWEHAVALPAVGPPSRGPVRVRVADLTHQRAPRPPSPTAVPAISLGFVAVPPAPAWSPATPTTPLERSRTDGPRLCLHTTASTLALDAVVRAVVEGGAGGNSPPKAGVVSPRPRWISAKASMDSAPCAAKPVARPPWPGPSTSCAIVRGAPSPCSVTTARALGCA